jgi:hypothetical protein
VVGNGLTTFGVLLHRLDDFEAFEFGVPEIQRTGFPSGVAVRRAECIRTGPAFECRMIGPDRVAGIQHMVLFPRPSQQMKFDEARHVFQSVSNALSEPRATLKRFIAMYMMDFLGSDAVS